MAHPFHNEETLANAVAELAEDALKQGLIPSYVVHHFRDYRDFYIPNEKKSEALSAEQAYLKLKQLVDGKAK